MSNDRRSVYGICDSTRPFQNNRRKYPDQPCRITSIMQPSSDSKKGLLLAFLWPICILIVWSDIGWSKRTLGKLITTNGCWGHGCYCGRWTRCILRPCEQDAVGMSLKLLWPYLWYDNSTIDSIRTYLHKEHRYRRSTPFKQSDGYHGNCERLQKAWWKAYHRLT